MVLVGIDPEFTRAGISIYYNGVITIDECKTPSSKFKTFEQVYSDAEFQSNQIYSRVKDLVVSLEGPIIVFMECPPPVGNYSPALYALDTLLIHRFWSISEDIFRIYPTYRNHLFGMRKAPKSLSVAFANEALESFKTDLRTKRLSHDEADSIIFLMRGLASQGLAPESLTKKYPGLLECKEKSLRFSQE